MDELIKEALYRVLGRDYVDAKLAEEKERKDSERKDDGKEPKKPNEVK